MRGRHMQWEFPMDFPNCERPFRPGGSKEVAFLVWTPNPKFQLRLRNFTAVLRFAAPRSTSKQFAMWRKWWRWSGWTPRHAVDTGDHWRYLEICLTLALWFWWIWELYDILFPGYFLAIWFKVQCILAIRNICQVDALWMVSCEKWQHPNIQRSGSWTHSRRNRKLGMDDSVLKSTTVIHRMARDLRMNDSMVELFLKLIVFKDLNLSQKLLAELFEHIKAWQSDTKCGSTDKVHSGKLTSLKNFSKTHVFSRLVFCKMVISQEKNG